MSPEIFDTYKDDHRQNCENVSQPAHIFVCFSALPHVDQIFFVRYNGNIYLCVTDELSASSLMSHCVFMLAWREPNHNWLSVHRLNHFYPEWSPHTEPPSTLRTLCQVSHCMVSMVITAIKGDIIWMKAETLFRSSQSKAFILCGKILFKGWWENQKHQDDKRKDDWTFKYHFLSFSWWPLTMQFIKNLARK